MAIDVKYYEDVYNNFARQCPMWAEDAVRCVPRHEHMIRVFLRNGDYIDYDERTGTFRYRSKGTIIETDDMTEEDSRELFSRNLLDIMRIRGIGQMILAERSGLSQVMISKYISKKATPSWINVKKIARALNCSIDELIE